MAMSDDKNVEPGLRRIKKSSLDKDLGKIERMEEATRSVTLSVLAPGAALLFLVLAGVLAAYQTGTLDNSAIIIAASIIGGYMALTIGANDVTNNVSPAVGARALTMTGALIIAAIFETAGALIAGGDVVETISKGIVDPAAVSDKQTFVWVMMAALLSSAIWVHLATWLGAPVSTTHAIVGGVLGAAIVGVGAGAVDWSVLGVIVLSWVVSPLFGGIVAAAMLAFIKTFIIYQDDKIAAARRWVPVLIAIMTASFAAYLMTKGLNKVVRLEGSTIGGLSLAIFVAALAIFRPIVRHQSEGLENRNQSLRRLFHIPLIFSAALLSFAHGANDVANAVGPLAAIIHGVEEGVGGMGRRVDLPLWVMLIGAFGISLGLLLYGPRLVLLVGEQITKMNPMRAYCVALSAALTVIAASWMGLPVSSTHIAVGAVFGVGFFREYYTLHSRRRQLYVKTHVPRHAHRHVTASDQEELRRRKLVRRSHFMTIIAAWIITVPAAALLAALLYLVMSSMF
ncbi:MAG: inorganic phosphate transporter [Hyphomicrobium sp.]